jgi:hypothetical protein
MLGLPLRVFNKEYKIFPLFTLFDFHMIEGLKGFIIGTTNQMVVNHNKLKNDVIVNLDTGKILIASEIPEKLLKLSKEEKIVYNRIFNKIKNNFDENEEWTIGMSYVDPVFDGSDDFIRNEIKNYFYDFFINFDLLTEIINSTNKEEDSFNLVVDSTEDNYSSESENEEQVEKKKSNLIFNPEKMQKILEKKTGKAINKLTNPYNVDFMAKWVKTTNYHIWAKLHEKNICFRSNYVKEATNINIIYENGDTYTGSLRRGKKHGFGIFNDIGNGTIYNGNWEDDQVNKI